MPSEPPITGVLLAAGIGSRYDPSGARLKLLEPAPSGEYAGVPIAVAALRNLRAAIPDIIVVLRPPDTPAQQKLHALLAAESAPLTICADARAGMGSSLACGVRASKCAAGWVIALADMPAVRPATIASVCDAIRHGQAAAAPRHAGRRGHPVGFGRGCRDALLALAGDEGARSVLVENAPQLIDVDDPGCLLDIDTPDG